MSEEYDDTNRINANGYVDAIFFKLVNRDIGINCRVP